MEILRNLFLVKNAFDLTVFTNYKVRQLLFGSHSDLESLVLQCVV